MKDYGDNSTERSTDVAPRSQPSLFQVPSNSLENSKSIYQNRSPQKGKDHLKKKNAIFQQNQLGLKNGVLPQMSLYT